MELDEKVRVIDGPEEEDREEVEMKAKKLGRISKEKKLKMMPKSLRKEKEKLGEEITELNNTYQEMFELALEQYGVDNIRDLPEDKKAEFFAVVDMALDEAKMAKKDHDGDGKVETSTAEYMGSRDKAIKKAMKKEEFAVDEDDLVVVIDEEMTTGYRSDMGHAGTQGTIKLGGKEHNARKVPMKHYDEFKKKHPGSKVMFRGPRDGKAMHTQKSNAKHFYIVHKKGGVKEEVEQVDELNKSTLSSYIQKAADPHKKKSNVNLASKAAYKLAKSDPSDMSSSPGEKEDRKAYMRSKGIQTAAKKLAKEELDNPMVELVKEYITSKQVRMAKGIANDPRHKGGDYSGAAEKMEKIKKGLSNHPAAKKALRQANEETELTFEEMTPAQKAERLKMIAQAHDRVLTGRTRDARRAGAAARKHMKDPKATKGMATVKKDEAMDEQVQKLRKMIKENNNKAEAYKLLAKILNTKTEGEQ